MLVSCFTLRLNRARYWVKMCYQLKEAPLEKAAPPWEGLGVPGLGQVRADPGGLMNHPQPSQAAALSGVNEGGGSCGSPSAGRLLVPSTPRPSVGLWCPSLAGLSLSPSSEGLCSLTGAARAGRAGGTLSRGCHRESKKRGL